MSLAQRQRNDIDIACQFLKGSQSDGARDIDPIKVRAQWLKGLKIGINEWLNSSGNTRFHEDIALSFSLETCASGALYSVVFSLKRILRNFGGLGQWLAQEVLTHHMIQCLASAPGFGVQSQEG